jgi:hypothetical protein
VPVIANDELGSNQFLRLGLFGRVNVIVGLECLRRDLIVCAAWTIDLWPIARTHLVSMWDLVKVLPVTLNGGKG